MWFKSRFTIPAVFIFVAASTLCFRGSAFGQTARGSDLDEFIVARMVEARTPGLSVTVVHNDAVVWSNAYGWADIDANLPATTDTLYLVASISKIVTATALMQLHEAGMFNLDEPINNHLPFPVNHPNPKYADMPITFRMVLSHTSALRDNWAVINSLTVCGDSSIPLAEFLEEYLVLGGQYYSATQSYYWTIEPGSQFEYSNVGFTLAGYLVEVISGMSFEQYCDENIFGHLGMVETSWFLDGLDITHIATPYSYAEPAGPYQAYCHLGMPIYPAGFLRTGTAQLAALLIAHMNGGSYNDVQLLQPKTVEIMQTHHAEIPPGYFYPASIHAYGLGFMFDEFGGHEVVGHGGVLPGCTTLMFFRPKDKVGIIVLANGEPFLYETRWTAWEAIAERLFEEFNALCPADLDANGSVGVPDLLSLLASWGPCKDCPADFDGNGDVGVPDLLALLANWGPCP